MKSKDKFINTLNKAPRSRKHAFRLFLNLFIKPVFIAITNRLPESFKQKPILYKLLMYTQHRIERPTGQDRIDRPVRTQRFFLKKGVKPIEFLEKLNQRKVDYVLLRWWESLPDYPAGEDINILVVDEHRDLINDLVSVFITKGYKCDIYTVSGAKNGSRFEVPLFPYNLSQNLLQTKVYFKGAYVPSPFLYFASVAYHAVLHKGLGSGVSGFENKSTNIVFDYTSVLTELALKLGISVEVTVQGLYGWLKKEGFAPADDTLTKLIENKPELSILGKSLFSDSRGGNLLVYIVRERLLNDGLLHNFKRFLEDKFKFDVIDVRVLNTKEKNNCKTQIRGGKWDNGPYKYSGGPPAAFVVAYDYHPSPLGKDEQKKQIRTTNKNNIMAKYRFRELLKSFDLIQGDYNGVHSADNEYDAWYYISQIGEDYREKISIEVETRRERYARIWGVIKVLSAGRICKVELIKYGEGLAVKKTFRPGKEKFFERELFAVKELSKELDFIPPLLEEGDGYVVVPYIENKSHTLPETEKKRVISKG